MCGTKGKECCICYCAGGCLASLRDDYYLPATKEQVEERLAKGEYKQHTALIKEYLKNIIKQT